MANQVDFLIGLLAGAVILGFGVVILTTGKVPGRKKPIEPARARLLAIALTVGGAVLLAGRLFLALV